MDHLMVVGHNNLIHCALWHCVSSQAESNVKKFLLKIVKDIVITINCAFLCVVAIHLQNSGL